MSAMPSIVLAKLRSRALKIKIRIILHFLSKRCILKFRYEINLFLSLSVFRGMK